MLAGFLAALVAGNNQTGVVVFVEIQIKAICFMGSTSRKIDRKVRCGGA